MIRYADTSALVPIYLLERFSAAAMAAIAAVPAVPLTAMHRLELNATVASQLGHTQLSSARAEAVLSLIAQDEAAGRLRPVVLDWELVFAVAVHLSARHTPATLARSLDVLHVAIAVRLGCREFVSGDDRQLAVAKLAGLTPIDIKTA